VVTDVRQQQLHGGQPTGGSSSSPLSQVVALSLSRLREEAGPLLTQLTAPGSGLGGIDLLGAVLLTELSTAVADGLPGKLFALLLGIQQHMHCLGLHIGQQRVAGVEGWRDAAT
jgi:hypothetical protein